MFKALKLRDRKEDELNGIKNRIKMCEESREQEKLYFDKKLKAYKEWLTKNNIQGINF